MRPIMIEQPKPTRVVYPSQDSMALGEYYTRHVLAMTAEGLHEKADIAEQLAWRDKRIAELEAELADVHELDEWKAKSPERSWVIDGAGWFWCRVCDWPKPGIRDARGFDGPTPAAARHAAAEWIRGQGK